MKPRTIAYLWGSLTVVATLVAEVVMASPVAASSRTVAGTAARPPDVHGWYRSPVVIHWTVSDPDYPDAAAPPDTIATTEGADVVYTSAPSCDPLGACVTGSLSISLDATAPAGHLAIAGGGTDSATVTVSLSTAAADSLSGVVEIRLSSDGSRWASYPYAATRTWSLTDPLYGGTPDQGTKVVYASWVDAAGNVSTPVHLAVTLDPVTRLAGPDRFSTAAAVSKAVFSPGVDVAYVANAFVFPDALAGAAAAGTLHGPVLLAAASGTLNEYTRAELIRLAPKKIYVLGGIASVGIDVYGQLAKLTPWIRRLAGPDRFSTAAAVSATIFSPGVDVAYVANAYNFPDALAGAAAAGTLHGPVLLAAATGTLNQYTRDELKRLAPTKIYVLGGTASIGSDIYAQVARIAPSIRLAGPDRFSTAAAVSKAVFSPGVDVAYVANAFVFPDALAGAAAAGTIHGPVLLAAPYGAFDAATTNELARLDPKRVDVLGGPVSVSDPAASQLDAFVASGAAELPLPAYPSNGNTWDNNPHDADGIVMVDYEKGRVYNPLTVAQAALGFYNEHLATGSADSRTMFLKHVDWLVANQTSDGLWLYTFAWGGQPIPWWSAMCQGMALSALTRAYRLTGDVRYADAARSSLQTFTRLQSNRGVVQMVGRLYWYEEYFPQYRVHVLNGFLFALDGLWEYRLTFGDTLSADLWNRGLATLSHDLPKFDTGSWSCYGFYPSGRCSLANVTYHGIHIRWLGNLYAITNQAILKTYADRFAAYALRPPPGVNSIESIPAPDLPAGWRG